MADTAGANGHSTDNELLEANGSTGQSLTPYHSLFSHLLSWDNPRNSAIAYASVVSTIIAVRYLNLFSWALGLSWMVLATTVAAELAGKLVLNTGLASQFRPRQYYTLSRETFERLVSDAHGLINFFLIEAQRIVFVENVGASAAACVVAFISGLLIKVVPYWALAIVATTIAFFAPLIYSSNQEFIDEQLKTAADAINAQTAQVKTAAQKQADHLAAVGKQYAGDYSGKIQEILHTKKAPVEFPSPPTEEPKAAEPAVPQEPITA
ncbi:cell lysis [Trichoderma arundinaceum]|uniref:Reticulon-like protein n=1 Tax=Trichoderma arundinaceum TaxID=490622 RepID=A0A395P1L4_TRIAR|nr:cell lysis [Trichoderma arundinaceum]